MSGENKIVKNKLFVCKEKYKNNRCYIITTCKNRAKFLFYLEYNECKFEDITCNLVEGVNVKNQKEQMLKETSPFIKSLGIGYKDANQDFHFKSFCKECDLHDNTKRYLEKIKEENAELKAENERLKGISRGELVEVLNQEQKELQTILQTRKETTEKILFKFESAFAYYDNEDMFSKKAIFECLEEIIKNCGVEIKE